MKPSVSTSSMPVMRRRPSTYLLKHNGHSVEVTYKDVKHLRLRVLPPDARLAVSSPRHVDEATIRAFVDANRVWIATAQQRVRMAAPIVEPLVDGGRARLWGQWRELRVSHADRSGAKAEVGVIELTGPDPAGLGRALDALQRRELKAALPPLLEFWQGQVGKEASQVKLRKMTSRWGTCNTVTGAITLNTRLAEHDPSALEYVLVHELVHLWERGHGRPFTARMDRHLPDWRARRSALNGRS